MKNQTNPSRVIQAAMLGTCLLFAGARSIQAANGTWTNELSSNWGDTNNWLNGTAANGSGSTAFFNAIDVPTNSIITVTADTDPITFLPFTVGHLFFGDTNPNTNGNWVVADAGGLTIDDTTTSNSVINVSLFTGPANNLNIWASANIGANLSGTNTLVKMGPSHLILNPTVNNAISGGMVISNGMVQLGIANTAGTANNTAPGTGPIIFRGGSLRLQNAAIPGNNPGNGGGGIVGLTVPVIVEAGQTGTIYLSPRAFPAISSTVTGSGTLNFACDFVRDNLAGDYSGFNGRMNIFSTTRQNGDLRWAFADPNTLSNVTVNITSNGVSANTIFGYSQMPVGTTLNIGALSGDVGFSFLASGGGAGAGAQNQINYMVGGLNTSTEYGGVFQTASGIIKVGSGTWRLSGANTQTGMFVISNGVVQIGGAAGAIGAASVTVSNYATLMFNRSGTLTAPNVIIGTGSVLVSNVVGGTVILTATNTYTGITTLKAGILAVPSEAPLGGDPGVFTANLLTFDGGILRSTNSFSIDDVNRGITLSAGGGTLSPDTNTTLTVANVIAGTGSLTVGGTGSVSLTGANTYSGKTILQAGTLVLGGESFLGTAPGGATADQLTLNGGTLNSTATFAIDDANRGITFSAGGGTISVNPGTTLTLSEPIVGSGALTKTGTGTVVINGASTRTGNTTISQGTYAVSALGSVSGSPLITVASGAVFDVSAAGFTLSSGQTLAGNGTVVGNLVAPAGSTLSAGTSAGLLSISGNLTLSGGTNFVEISSSTNDVINVTGSLTLTGVSTINLSLLSSLPVGTYQLIKYGTTLSGTVANLAIAGYPPSRLVATLVHNAGTKSIDLVISGTAASLVWQGGLNANAWDVLNTSNWLNGVLGDVFYNGDAVTFDNTGSANPNVNLTVAVIPSTATVNSTTDYTFSGNGKLTGLTVLNKAGANKLTILTTNDSSGTTTISGGTVQVGNGTASGSLGTGSVVDNAALTFNVPGSINVANPISGAGSLTVQGGTVILTANNSYGASVVDSGTTLQVGNGGTAGSLGSGAVSDNGALVFNRTGTTTNSGSISGSGSLAVQLGVVALAANNSYVGPTTVSAGTLQVGVGGIAGTLGTAGSVTLTNAGTLSFNRSDVVTNIVAVLGTNGTLAQVGAGTLVITNDSNDYGPTLISGGRLHLGDGVNASGKLGNGTVTATTPGSLVFNRPDALVFSNTIAGNGSVIQAGPGSVTFLRTTANTYSGGTTISNSTLVLAIPAGLAGQAQIDAVVGSDAGAGTGAVTFQGSTGVFAPVWSDVTDPNAAVTPNIANALIIPAGQTGRFEAPGRFTLGSAVSGAGTLNYGVQHVRGDITGIWTNFTGTVNVVTNGINTNNPAAEFRWANTLGLPNARLNLTGPVTMYSRGGANQFVPIGQLTGEETTSLRAASGGGTSAGVNENWVIGGLNTDATFAGTILDGNSIIKVGTGKWTLTAANGYTGNTTVSNGVLVLATNSLGADASIASSATITLASPGVLDVTGLTTGTLDVSTILAGNGTNKGNVNVSLGTLAPGFSSNVFGNLTITGNLTVDSTVNMKIDHVGPTVSSDRASAPVITINGGATLNVTQVSTNNLITGDTFKLFSGPISGAGFGLVLLPAQNIDATITYVWTNKLAIDGTIVLLSGGTNSVNTNPTNLVATFGGGLVHLSWPVDHTGWRLQAQTNATSIGYKTNWADVPGSTSVNAMDVPISTANGTVFFRLIYP